jgi:16S rRNA (guanine527-N7)-methyltransferase
VKHEPAAAALRAEASRLGADLDDPQIGSLIAYERLLVARAVPMGLVAEGDVEKIRVRHVLDSLRAAPVLSGMRDAYDLGSGAGLPGIVVAIARPEVQVGLVDSRRRRVAFLELAVVELGLSNATILGARAETLTEPVDACLARAFAPADRAWEVAEPLLRPGGRLVYFAGPGWEAGSAPPGVRVDVLDTPVLESAGPLVIMAQQ